MGNIEEMRTGESWERFLADYRLSGIDGEGSPYHVHSMSGRTYEVTLTTHLDAGDSMYFRWHCGCPAKKQCRHIDAVEQMRWNEAAAMRDYDGMDVMERES